MLAKLSRGSDWHRGSPGHQESVNCNAGENNAGNYFVD